jgi:hypothetical protein
MENQSSFQTNPEEKPQKPRKQYEKPAVIYLAPLEAIAGNCAMPQGKAIFDPLGAICNQMANS